MTALDASAEGNCRPCRVSGLAPLRDLVGHGLGYSRWHRVTQEMVNGFADVTGDHQWIHIDTEKARTGPFGATISHGFLTLALAPMLVADVLEVEGISMSVNYGVDRVRFPAPLLVGSEVRAGVELTALRPLQEGVQVTLRATIEVGGGTKPVCVADLLALFYE